MEIIAASRSALAAVLLVLAAFATLVVLAGHQPATTSAGLSPVVMQAAPPQGDCCRFPDL